jgi:hypothetical protein
MRVDTHCLFFGLDWKADSLHTVAVDGWGRIVLRARFPLVDPCNTDLEAGPAAPVAQMLTAFIQAYDAELRACGANYNPPVLEALAKHLGGPVRYVDVCDLQRTTFPGVPMSGHDLLGRTEPGTDAHHRALLAGLAAAANNGE